MSSRVTKVSAILGVGLLAAMAGVVSAQQPSATTSTQMGAPQTQKTSQNIDGTIAHVDGNKVTVTNASGKSNEYTVPDGFKFQMGGKDIGLADLKAGMKVSATVTTTVTTTPVTVTEIRKGSVLNVSGGTVIVRGPQGVKKFTQADLDKRHIKLMKDGKPTEISGFQAGDIFTAVIVTDEPPKVVSEREAKAMVQPAPTAVPAPAAAPPAPAPAPVAAAPAPAPAPAAAPAKKLPKTGSDLPLVGLLGLALLASALGLRTIRRFRTV